MIIVSKHTLPCIKISFHLRQSASFGLNDGRTESFEWFIKLNAFLGLSFFFDNVELSKEKVIDTWQAFFNTFKISIYLAYFLPGFSQLFGMPISGIDSLENIFHRFEWHPGDIHNRSGDSFFEFRFCPSSHFIFIMKWLVIDFDFCSLCRSWHELWCFGISRLAPLNNYFCIEMFRRNINTIWCYTSLKFFIPQEDSWLWKHWLIASSIEIKDGILYHIFSHVWVQQDITTVSILLLCPELARFVTFSIWLILRTELSSYIPLWNVCIQHHFWEFTNFQMCIWFDLLLTFANYRDNSCPGSIPSARLQGWNGICFKDLLPFNVVSWDPTSHFSLPEQ